MASFSPHLQDIPTSTLLLASVSLATAWLISRLVYNRFFHPLAHVPGPFWASLSELYRFYHNFAAGNGALYHQFEPLRDKYGPVIRIAPNEVLLADPAHYDGIYSMTSKHAKDPAFYTLAGAPGTVFSTVDDRAHRRKRAILNPFFSRRAVLGQEDVVQAKVAQLCDRIAADSARNIPTDFTTGTRALAVDVLTEYAFGAENCFRSLDAADLGGWFNELMRGVAPMIYFFRVFPFLQRPMLGMPYWLARRVNPLVTGLMGAKLAAEKQIQKVLQEIQAGIVPTRPTIFHTIISPPPDADTDPDYNPPPISQIVDEAYGLTGAASDTTGNVMCMAAFHVLQDENRDIRRELQAELAEAFPHDMKDSGLPYQKLEKLPYLTAVIKEGLRLSYGVIHPIPRVVVVAAASSSEKRERGGVVFNGVFVPSGSIISMSNYLNHRDSTAFPSPDKFDPMRWLGDDPEAVRHREKLLTPFSRGSRACLGQSLAMCEIYVAIGTLFHRFGDALAAYDVGPEDLVYEDYFIPFHPVTARKFRVVLS